MLFRAERLLEEYAEAKLAMMGSLLTSAAAAADDDDDSDDDDGGGETRTSTHGSSNAVNSRGHDSRKSSAVNSKAGRKSYTVSHSSSRHRENPASSRVSVHRPVRGSSASRGIPASRENRGAKLAGKQSKCFGDCRSPLGTIGQQSNLLILGQHALPPVPSEYFHRSRGYLGN